MARARSKVSEPLEDLTQGVGEAVPGEQVLIPFYKYQGLGNDFVCIDNRHSSEPMFTASEGAAMCDRNFGIGADGVIFLMPAPDLDAPSSPFAGVLDASDGPFDYGMRMYNSDGSEPEMCGNGIRCLARFACELECADADAAGEALPSLPRSFRFATLAGAIVPDVHANGQVSVDMGEPRLQAHEVPTTLENTTDEDGGAVVLAHLEVGGDLDAEPSPEEMFMPYEERMSRVLERTQKGRVKEHFLVTCVSMGNPHCVTFGRPGAETLGGVLDIDALDVDFFGPAMETHEAFPEKINVHFCATIYEDPDSTEDLTDAVRVVHWERGAGRTLACGTGACSVVVAGVLEGRLKQKCMVYVPGGPLMIEWRKATDNKVIMTGPAELVYKGFLPAVDVSKPTPGEEPTEE